MKCTNTSCQNKFQPKLVGRPQKYCSKPCWRVCNQHQFAARWLAKPENLEQARKSQRERQRARRLLDPQSVRDACARWRAKNRDYTSNRLIQDPQFKLAYNIRRRLQTALNCRQGGKRGGSAVRDLGCSLAEFRVYIEEKFQPGMSWNNWGEWHLDHIIPLAIFDLTKLGQFREACHYTNYQPLWAHDNLVKNTKWEI